MKAAVSDHGPGGSEKWGEAARAGFQPVPDTLLVKQRELGLDSTDLVVLLNLTSFWWFRDAPPFPRTNIIANRMGVTTRTVQRSLKKLEVKGYIRRDDFHDGTKVFPAVYFEGLVEKLVSLAKSDAALSVRLMRSANPNNEFSGMGESPF
jgi:predicted transcriptional regulator